MISRINLNLPKWCSILIHIRFFRMNRILRVQLRRKSLYENLDISPSASTEEVLSKIARLSKDGGIVDEQMARQIARFRKSRFDYDVIVALEEKEAKLHGREPLPPFINPDTERRIVSTVISYLNYN